MPFYSKALETATVVCTCVRNAIFCSFQPWMGKMLEKSPYYIHMMSDYLSRSKLSFISPPLSPNSSFCPKDKLLTPFLTPNNKTLVNSQRNLISREQSQKLQKDRSARLVPGYNSEKSLAVKSYLQRRNLESKHLEASEPLPAKKLNLDLMACSDPQQYGKTRESFSTQPPSCKSLSGFPRLKQYLLLRRIGEGRFGSVYLAVHKKSGFVGAMKVLSKNDINSCEQKREKIQAQIISQIKIQFFLDHPNLVQLYDCFCDKDNLYLFVELGCEGHLYELLKRKRNLSEQAISIIVREVAKGINYMHSHNVLHRDIKLQNIVFTHGMAKICDFGWAIYEPQELRTTICGTPLYLAPEMLCGKSYDSKIDLWALGTLTHELLTNENPFKITNHKQLRKILTEQVLMSKGSPQIKSFITFVLNKNPERRPDAEIALKHPFIKKYEQIETSQETVGLTRLNNI